MCAQTVAEFWAHKKALGTIAGKPFLVELSDIHAHLICPPLKDSSEAKEADYLLILFSAR